MIFKNAKYKNWMGFGNATVVLRHRPEPNKNTVYGQSHLNPQGMTPLHRIASQSSSAPGDPGSQGLHGAL